MGIVMVNNLDNTKYKDLYNYPNFSKTSHTKINDLGQNFNYHTHTYSSGHSEYASDEEILQVLKGIDANF